MMNNTIKTLKPLELSLNGHQLIEASAGTGKTFTIAILYIRLILGHGNNGLAFQGTDLSPVNILVATFTDAATEELRDRIRARLSEAASVFRADLDTHVDPLLAELRSDFPTHLWATCARRLELASESMDEAAVSTIHSWCLRMLREHAFASQSLFKQDLVNDNDALLEEAVWDFWRDSYYALPADTYSMITEHLTSPSALFAKIKRLKPFRQLLLKKTMMSHQVIHDIQTQSQEFFKPIWAALTPKKINNFEEKLNQYADEKHIKQNKLHKRYYAQWIQALRDWSHEKPLVPSKEILTIASKLSASHLLASYSKGFEECPESNPLHKTPIPKALEQLAELDTEHNKYQLELAALSEVNERFEQKRRRLGQFDYDQCLLDLKEALLGPHGKTLAEIIRKQFPVAMIDEFQDTDPTQYTIFSQIYSSQSTDQHNALILIGDPKQAIYSFRGADIYTYIKARQAAQGNIYNLDTNYRSTQNMVAVSNRFFTSTEQDSSSQGAFLMRTASYNPIPFIAVNAQGRNDFFSFNDKEVSALQLYISRSHEQEKYDEKNYFEEMSIACATQVANWLSNNSCGFMSKENELTPLKSSDIAILVNNRNEADHIKTALSQANIRSVYLSERSSVYESPVAQDVLICLKACAQPQSHHLIKAALLTSLLATPLTTIDLFNHDEQLWEEQQAQFINYKSIWQNHGVLPMIRRLMNDFHCATRLLQDDNGERLLTDLLHLAELLQTASFHYEGELALIRYFEEGLVDTAKRHDSDANTIRLESDAELIKIVTIHKSKGLEYPIVMLPFISHSKRHSELVTVWHQDHERRGSMSPSEEERGLAHLEQHAEDLRKFYVALTRARYCTWLGLAKLSKSRDSAINYLLKFQDIPAQEYSKQLQEYFKATSTHIISKELTVIPQLSSQRMTSHPTRARSIVERQQNKWWIASYTAISTHSNQSIPEDSLLSKKMAESHQEQASLDLNPAYPLPSLTGAHRFIRHARAGIFMHDIMEWCQNTGFSSCLENPDELDAMIEKKCLTYRWEVWEALIKSWVRRILQRRLPIDGTTGICMTEIKNSYAEMEFWLGVDQVNSQELDAIVQRYTLDQAARPDIQPKHINGMLKGFIDLVFEHEGKYYILDYKTNYLGADDQAYHSESLQRSILENRYDLQYVLYSYALHKHLKTRLQDYDPEKHIGGALYFYLRGINAPNAGLHTATFKTELFEELDDLFASKGGL